MERRVGAVGRCTEHYELLAANHRLLWLSAFGAELETRLRVQDGTLTNELMSPANGVGALC